MFIDDSIDLETHLENYHRFCRMIEGNFIKLNDVPSDYLSDELIEISLKADGANIKYVPRNKLDWFMLKKTIKYDPCNIRHIPKKYYSRELYIYALLEAMRRSDDIYLSVVVGHLPKSLLIPDIVTRKCSMRLVSISETFIKFVPTEHQDKKYMTQ